MQHMVAGPIFALGLAGLALLYGYQLRFTSEDWQALAKVFRRETDRDKFISQQQELLKKSTFWLSILLAIPIIFSVTLSMYPLYGPQDQDMLLKLHGYTGLVLLLVFVVYCWSAAAAPKASAKQTKPKNEPRKDGWIKMKRRDFLKKSAALAGATVAAPMFVPSTVFGSNAPSNRITIGCIGVGGMGTVDMRAFINNPNAEVVAVCDVDTSHRENARLIANLSPKRSL